MLETIKTIIFGIEVALTPSMLIFAWTLWPSKNERLRS